MLALIAIACCVALPLIVAGIALLVGRNNDNKIEHSSAPLRGTVDREGSRRRRGGQP